MTLTAGETLLDTGTILDGTIVDSSGSLTFNGGTLNGVTVIGPGEGRAKTFPAASHCPNTIDLSAGGGTLSALDNETLNQRLHPVRAPAVPAASPPRPA